MKMTTESSPQAISKNRGDMKRLFYICTLGLLLNGAAAIAAQPTVLSRSDFDPIFENCVEGLSIGRNAFKTRINEEAIRELRDGLRQYRSKLNTTDMALLVDYSKNSKSKRAYLIDFKKCEVISHEYVIHGGAIYHPREIRWGEPERDGQLKRCVKSDGTRKYMTRPGFYHTMGCHHTQLNGWTTVYGDCNGIKLNGLEKSNAEAYTSGIVLHEHVQIPNDSSVKPLSQGCPAFPPGRLKAMATRGIATGMLVFLYVPQCKGPLK